MLVADVPAGLLHQALLLLGQHDVLPGIGGGHAAGQLAQAVHRLLVAALVQQPAPYGLRALQPGQAPGLGAGRRDLPRRKAELGRQLFQAAIRFQAGPGQRAAQQLQPFLLGGQFQLQLDGQTLQPAAGPLRREEKALAAQKLHPAQPGHHGPVGGQLLRPFLAVQVVQAQAGPGQVGGQGRVGRPLGPVLAVQPRKDAAAPAAGHQVLDLEFFARARRPRQQDGAALGPGHRRVQAAGRLLLDQQRRFGLVLFPVPQPQLRPAGDGAGGQVFAHHVPQHKAALGQLFGLEQPQKAALPGKARQALLGLFPRLQEQLDGQGRVGGAAGHVVLQIGEELFILAVHHRQVGQHHAAEGEVVQIEAHEQFQQRQRLVRAAHPRRQRRLDRVQLRLLARVQLAVQPALGGPRQVMLKLFPRDHQPQHVFQLAVGPQPLVAAVVLVQQQVHPGGQVLQQLALRLVSGVGPARLDGPQFFPLHRAPHGVCTVRAGVRLTWITPP